MNLFTSLSRPSAEWMIATLLMSALLAIAAAVLERALLMRRGTPVRWVWATAMLGSVVCAMLWLRPVVVTSIASDWRTAAATSLALADARRVAPATTLATPVALAGEQGLRDAHGFPLSSLTLAHRFKASVATNRLLNRLWVAISFALLLVFLATHVKLAQQRRAWPREIVRGVNVRLSEDFGPAIVGLVHPVVVLPSWVLALDEKAQRTIVMHEEEHLQARDPQLLNAMLALCVLMPWSIALWFMWRRLVRAIELDCDARVIRRGVPVVDYANALLGAWQEVRGHRGWIPVPAFAERASGLGRRVEHILRPMPRRWHMKALAIAAVSVMIASATAFVPNPRQAVPGKAASTINQTASQTRPPESAKTMPASQVKKATNSSPAVNKRANWKVVSMQPRKRTQDAVAAVWFNEEALKAPAEIQPYDPKTQAKARIVVLGVDNRVSLQAANALRNRLQTESGGELLYLVPQTELNSVLRISGYSALPTSLSTSDQRALSQLVRADFVISFVVNPASGSLQTDASFLSGSRLERRQISVPAASNIEELSELLANALRADSAFQRLRR